MTEGPGKGAGYRVPPPRVPVGEPGLIRPDWTGGVSRDPRLLWADRNENTDPELAAVVAKILSEVDYATVLCYPACGPLYRKLAAYLGVRPDQLLLAAGSDGVIRAVFEAFINPGDLVVYTQPTFGMYAVYVRMFGAQAVALEYRPSNRGPVLPVDSVVKTIAEVRPKLVCLPNPDSPTGTAFSTDALRWIIEAAGDVGALILCDEAYYPFYDYSALSCLQDYPHLVISRTFAKAWGLAGLRIGYAIANVQVTALLHKVRPMYEVNAVAVAVAERMLDVSHEMLLSVQRLNAGRDGFLSAMDALGLHTLHSNGNFLHVRFGSRAPAVHSALRDLVLYREDSTDECIKGFSRFSAMTVERFQPVINRVRQVYASDQ